MTILTLRTDKPEAEIGLYDNQQQLLYKTWTAHRQLAETLHTEIEQLLSSHSKNWSNIEGVIVYQGPGSFTGLRIGLSVANTLAYSYKMPIVGVSDDNWLEQGLERLLRGDSDKQVVPLYGAPPHTTLPKN